MFSCAKCEFGPFTLKLLLGAYSRNTAIRNFTDSVTKDKFPRYGSQTSGNRMTEVAPGQVALHLTL